MKFMRVKIAPEEYMRLPEGERLFLFQMLHFLNEVRMLDIVILVPNNQLEQLENPEKGARIARSLFFMKVLAGVLHEAWKAISSTYFPLAKSRKYDLPKVSEDALKNLSKYFAKPDNLVKHIRNKHAFHHDRDRFSEGIGKLLPGDDLEILMSELDANFFCHLAETVDNAALLAYIDPSDEKLAFDTLFDDLLSDVSVWFKNFAGGFCYEVGNRLQSKMLDEDFNVVSISEVDLPYFVKRDP